MAKKSAKEVEENNEPGTYDVTITRGNNHETVKTTTDYVYWPADRFFSCEHKIAFRKKMLEAKKTLAPIIADMINPRFNNPYPSAGQILEKVKAACYPIGLDFEMESEHKSKEDVVDIYTTFIDSETGYEKEFCHSVATNNATPQGSGAAYTYGVRYALKMIFGIACEKDDDGNKAQDETKQKQAKNHNIQKTVDVFDPENSSHKNIIGNAIINEFGSDLSKERLKEYASDIKKLMLRRPLTDLSSVIEKYFNQKIMEE